MFCMDCGTQLTEQTNFCPTCGRKISGEDEQQTGAVDERVAAREEQRLKEIERLDKARIFFSQQYALYNEHQRARKSVSYYGRGAKSVLLVFGCITLGLWMSLGTIILISSGLYDLITSIVPLAVFFLIPGCCMLTGGILMKVINRSKFKRWKAEEAQLAQQIYALCTQYPDCPVDPIYTNPNILSILQQNLNTGRANTIEESLALALAEFYKSGMSRYITGY